MSTINIQIVQYLIKINIYENKKENMTHSHKKKKSIEISPEFTEIVESTDKIFNSYYKYNQGFKENHSQNEKRNRTYKKKK